jgi:nitrogenase molybdenum-iron protein alpha/beta subunit
MIHERMVYDVMKDLEASEVVSRNAIRDTFLARTFNWVYQGTTWQLHQYGLNCKLSGSVYAVTEIENAIPLVHGPIGYAFHQRLTPRRMHSPIKDMPCTCIDENAVIHGGEDKLREKIVETYNRYKPELIAVLPTCVSGLIGDDMQGVISEVEVPCDILYVPSEGFAHRSRESLEVMLKEHIKEWKDPIKFRTRDTRGCGFDEVLQSFVEQLMEEQDVDEHSVNIEFFGGRYNYGFKRQLEETKELFNRMGVRINTTLLNCTVDELKKAPAAELNLVGRGIRWAEQMEKEFGTRYLFRRWFSYTGLDGAEKFLMDIASRLGLDGEAEEVVLREKSRVLRELERYRKIFKNYEFALISNGFFHTPHSLRTYPMDFNIPLKYLCVDTHRLKDHNVSDETIDNLIRAVEDFLGDWDLGIELIINPTISELNEVTKKVDFVLGDHDTASIYEKEGICVLNPSVRHRSSPFGFNGQLEFAMNLVREINRGHNQRKPIFSRFDYDETYYSILADSVCLASREMWSILWRLKSDMKKINLSEGGEMK